MMAGEGDSSAGERAARRRHLSHGHVEVGKAKPGAGNPGVGRGALHPVRQMRDGLPARGDSRRRCARPEQLADAPEALKSAAARWKDREQLRYLLQVAPEDCTGCGLCVQVCPAKSKSEAKKKAINMAPQAAASASRSGTTGISSWTCRSSTAMR